MGSTTNNVELGDQGNLKQEYQEEEQEMEQTAPELQQETLEAPMFSQSPTPSSAPLAPEAMVLPLKFENFSSHAVQTFSQLQQRPEFCDVTLITQGQPVGIHAHKFVLSAGSKFFDNLFRATPTLPLVFLRQVRYSDLVSIVKYLYTGEVNVPECDLQSILALANDLKITGLSKLPEEETPIVDQEENYDNVNPLKTEPQEAFGQVQDENRSPIHEAGHPGGSDASSHSGSISKDDICVLKDGSARCMVCGKTLSSRTNAVRHLKATHLDAEKIVTCAIKKCGKQFKGGEEKMKAHLRSAHKIYQKNVKK